MAWQQCDPLNPLGGGDVQTVTVKDVANRDIKIYKWGQMVQFNIGARYTVNSGQYPTIFTVPEGYRPPVTLHISTNANQASIKNQVIDVSMNGPVQLNGYLSTGDIPIYETVTYLTEQ